MCADAKASRARQNVLIDIGASAYGTWNGREAYGARWFVDRCGKLDIDTPAKGVRMHGWP